MHTLSPFRIAEDASLYCYRKDAGRAKSLTAQASAMYRANQDAPSVWAQASKEWAALGLIAASNACAKLAKGERS